MGVLAPIPIRRLAVNTSKGLEIKTLDESIEAGVYLHRDDVVRVLFGYAGQSRDNAAAHVRDEECDLSEVAARELAVANAAEHMAKFFRDL